MLYISFFKFNLTWFDLIDLPAKTSSGQYLVPCIKVLWCYFAPI